MKSTINMTSNRHTITIDHSTFMRLKNKGHFNETYSQLITRLLDKFESVNGESKDTVTTYDNNTNSPSQKNSITNH
jgi:hypothetical protein